MRRLLTALTLLIAPALAAQSTTGLSGWSVVIDPGHSLRENQGAYGYSEAEKTLGVGLELRRLLVETTDISQVFMTRESGSVDVSLAERVAFANRTGADYFQSIHSNAAAPEARSLFVLWPQYPEDGTEAVPQGGRAIALHMADLLTRGMRVPKSGPTGTYGECDFYGASTCRSRSVTGPDGKAKGGSRNYVQSYTAMASSLAESGFHTNPEQNQRNMNADWKRMEARAMYWGFLKYHNAARPSARIAMGIVRDSESTLPVNGATVEIAGKAYTTDTYESLFKRFSNDPNLLRNGFYYLEDLPAGPQQVTVTADGFEPFTTTVATVDTFFTIVDLDLISTAPPTVASSAPANNATSFRVIDPIVITFSRPMDRESVEEAFSISPAVGGSFAWTQGNRRLTFAPDSLVPFTEYTVTIAATAKSPYGYELDGDGDGTSGGAYTLTFETGPRDVVPPRIAATNPRPNTRGVERRPVLTVVFNELVDHATVVPSRVWLAPTAGGGAIAGRLQAHDVKDQTVVSFAPAAPLEPGAFYKLTIEPGLKDVVGNATTGPLSFSFSTRDALDDIRVIESFEGNFTASWWEPLQSGSTARVDSDSTRRTAETSVVSPLGGSQSMGIQYGWLTSGSGAYLIRTHLSGGPAFNVTFDDSYRLQAYVFGDGSGTLFRFSVREISPNTIEVGPWHKIDWLGWRLVEWDLSKEAPGSWIGNGTLEGNLRYESVQLSYDGGDVFGKIYVDDLRVARSIATSTEPDDELPSVVTLHANAPNPFAEQTAFAFSVPTAMPVTLRVFDALGREVAVLVDGQMLAAGSHRVEWQANGLSSGTYLVRLEAGGTLQTRAVTLLR